MKIGVVPGFQPVWGGIYQYSITMVRALFTYSRGRQQHSFTVFDDDPSHSILAEMPPQRWDVRTLHAPSPQQATMNRLRTLVGHGPHRRLWQSFRLWMRPSAPLPDPERIHYRPEMERWFRSASPELMIYPTWDPLAFESRLPFIMPIHDLQHRLQPEFAEVGQNGEWEKREYIFRNIARNATLLLADSEVGREDIVNCYGEYGVTADRVKVLPYLPACYLAAEVSKAERERVRAKYHLPARFYFYPAQFWPHKNHARIIEAVAILRKQKGLQIHVAFCGSHGGELREAHYRSLMALARQLDVEDNIHLLGYVPDEDMSGLYSEAHSLVMPTFFGPTNIPPLEAWSFGCPVITSDIRGIRDQMGDAARLVDPREAEAIADGFFDLETNEPLRQTLIARGRQRLSAYTPNDYQALLDQILDEAVERVQRGDIPHSATTY